MTAIFECEFTVRQYECDGYGHMNNVMYVRWMEEAALRATAAVGWPPERYAALGTRWIIRDTEIEYLRPLRYGETVTIRTWVEGFRRVHSWRRYEVVLSDGSLAARAVTDWVYMDIQRSRPITIPAELMADFQPQETLAATPQERFVMPAARPSQPFRHTKRVEWRDIDVLGHANNATYLAYIEDTFSQAGEFFGWGIGRLQAANIAAVVRRWRVQYLHPAYLNDRVEIETFIGRIRQASFVRHYLLWRDSTLLAQANVLAVFCDVTTGRPLRPPQGIREVFATNQI